MHCRQTTFRVGILRLMLMRVLKMTPARGRKGMEHRQPIPLRRGRCLVLAVVLLLLGGLGIQRAQGQWRLTSQADVQAVYLYIFAKFVRWPNGKTDGSFDICVAGQ